MIFWYFVFFSWVRDTSRGWGNAEVPMPNRISSLAEVKVIQAYLREEYGEGDYLVAHFRLLRGEEDENVPQV